MEKTNLMILVVLCISLLCLASAWTVIPTRRHHYYNTNTKLLVMSSAMSNTSPVKNNVVLRPSTDSPTAPDSFKIGNPRVHRYDDGGLSDAAYVMWYHGRPFEFGPVEDNLPPLSTGRIMRAVSRNGLVWKKCTDESSGASASEDVAGVSLGVNRESWWSFDTAHVGLGQVSLPLSTPAIMTQGGVYLMYYGGGNYEESDPTDFMTPAAVERLRSSSTSSSSTTNPLLVPSKGMKMRIGIALSQDGQTWGRVEGDDPTGAVIVPEGDELYCAWPDVVCDEDNKDWPFTMYYSTMTNSTKQKILARAVSKDGFRWEKRGVCLVPDEDNEDSLDAAGIARPTVVRRMNYDADAGKWTPPLAQQQPWMMYYEGVSPRDNKHRVLRAESTDGGKTWIKKGLVLDVGREDDDDWDCMGVGTPHILRMDDGRTRLYYTGQGRGGTTAIGVAVTSDGGSSSSSSDDGVDGPFTREQAEFTIS